MTDKELINEYRKIKTLSHFCRELGLDRANLVSGRYNAEKEKEVARLCKNELIRMYNILILGEDITCQ